MEESWGGEMGAFDAAAAAAAGEYVLLLLSPSSPSS
jgi:hypothetical protein